MRYLFAYAALVLTVFTNDPFALNFLMWLATASAVLAVLPVAVEFATPPETAEPRPAEGLLRLQEAMARQLGKLDTFFDRIPSPARALVRGGWSLLLLFYIFSGLSWPEFFSAIDPRASHPALAGFLAGRGVSLWIALTLTPIALCALAELVASGRLPKLSKALDDDPFYSSLVGTDRAVSESLLQWALVPSFAAVTCLLLAYDETATFWFSLQSTYPVLAWGGLLSFLLPVLLFALHDGMWITRRLIGFEVSALDK